MGESACLFMHASAPQDHGIALDSPQRSRHQLAFEGSVTFGRFASEGLSWEKWSAFSHNRVMEEVAKYSTPGSVAQKKAYFEAHYKRIAAAKKAAALLEQEKTVASSSTSDVDPLESVGAESLCGVETVAAVNLSPVGLGDAALDLLKEVLVSNVVEEQAMEVDIVAEDAVEEQAMEVDMVAEDVVEEQAMKVDMVVEDVVEEQAMKVDMLVEDRVDVETLPVIHSMPGLAVEESCSTSVVIDDTFHRSDQKINDEVCSISAAVGAAPLHRPDQEPLHRPDQTLIVEESSKLKKYDYIKEKRPKLSGLRSSIHRMTSKLLPSPSKLSTPTLPRQNNCDTPGVKRSPKDALEKRKSVLRTLHMSINSSPWSISKNTVSASKKRPSPIPEKSQVTRSSSFISGHQKAAKTPTSASVNRSLKLTLATPPTENLRKKVASDIVSPANRISLDKTLQSRSSDRARTSTSSTTSYSARSPTIPVAFTLRSDERAAKRREYQLKLEEKFNAEAQKLLIQAKAKGQTKPLNDLCQSVCSKAKPMPDSCRQPGGHLINHTKKIPPTLPRFPTPKPVKKSSRAAAEKLKYQPPPRPPIKIDSSNKLKQNIRTTARSLTYLRKEKTLENTSPNIQS